MAALRHRISRLFAPSEESGTDSVTSTRAIFGSGNSTPSRESADSDSMRANSTLEDLQLKVEPAVDASPHTLKKAASTTFQAFSSSIRLRAQSFYATSTGSPPRSGRKTSDKLDESFEKWSPSGKRNDRIPRSDEGDPFCNSKKEKPQNASTQPTVGSPKAANSSSPLWASIKKRAGSNPHSKKAIAQGQTETLGSPNPSVDDLAPSLDVEIPDHMLSLSQHLQRRNSRWVQPGLPESPPKAPSHSPIDLQMPSRSKLRTPRAGRNSVKGASNFLPLQSLFEPTDIYSSPAYERDGTKNNGGKHIRFLPLLNTPLRIPLPPSPSEKTLSPTSSLDSTPLKTLMSSEEYVTLAQPRSPIIRRGRSLQRGLNSSSTKNGIQERHPLFSAGDGDRDNLHNDKSPMIDQESMPTTPERPNMGSRPAMNKARADRKERYLALLDQDLETASDTETDPDLNLVPSPARTFWGSSHKPTTIRPDNSSQDLDHLTDKFRFAVEAIERTSGTVYDQSTLNSEESFDHLSTHIRGDLPYMIEATERTSGTVSDQSASSSTDDSNQVATLFRSDLPYMVEAIERNSGMVNGRSVPSGTENSNKVSTLFRGGLPYMVAAIERTSGTANDRLFPSSTHKSDQVPTLFRGDLPCLVECMPHSSSPVQKSSPLELKDTERIRVSSPGLLEGPPSGNADVVQIPRETVDGTGGTSLAQIVQGIRESKTSSESTVAAESDPFLGVRQDRMQNKVDRIKAPIPEKNGTMTNQSKPLGLPSPSSSNYSSSTDETCALTTHDPLCYAPSPWPTVHCRTSPSPDRAIFEHTTQIPSNDDGNGDEKDAKLESQIDEYNRSPWSNLLFDNDIEDAPEPLPPKDTGLSEITLPASTFLKLSPSELQLRPRKDHDSEIRHTASQRGHNRSVTSDLDEVALQKFEYSPNSMERPFNAARLPAFGETLPQLTYCPPRGRKVPSKARRPVRYKPVLADISGNADKAYTYSQIVKGDNKVDQLKRSLEMIGSLEEDVPNEKGVSWAKEDELIGYADPQTPISKRISPDSLYRTLADRHDVNQRYDTSNKENAASVGEPALEQDFRVSHYMVMNAGIDTPDVSFSKMLGKQPQIDEKQPPEMTPSARKIFKNLFKVDGTDTAMEGATYDINVSPWNESEKKSVAKHLMSVVYDLEELSAKAGLEEDGDESEEKGEEDGDESDEKGEEDGAESEEKGEEDGDESEAKGEED